MSSARRRARHARNKSERDKRRGSFYTGGPNPRLQGVDVRGKSKGPGADAAKIAGRGTTERGSGKEFKVWWALTSKGAWGFRSNFRIGWER